MDKFPPKSSPQNVTVLLPSGSLPGHPGAERYGLHAPGRRKHTRRREGGTMGRGGWFKGGWEPKKRVPAFGRRCETRFGLDFCGTGLGR